MWIGGVGLAQAMWQTPGQLLWVSLSVLFFIGCGLVLWGERWKRRQGGATTVT
jgi:hypothetical protein